MAKKKSNVIGSWSFLIGLVLAIIFGLVGSISPNIALILVIIGLIVGLLNIADEEATPFMMSGVVLIIAGGLGANTLSIIPIVGPILDALLIIFVPATIVVAIRNVFSLAKN